MTRAHLRLTLGIPLALALVASLSVAGEARTPLGKWMKPNMGTPMAGQDFPTLKTSLDLVASKPPPSGDYGKWASISSAGSAAAAKQDLAGVKASCKQCHDMYKEKYVKDFVSRPFP
jgi:hypothetical protein